MLKARCRYCHTDVTEDEVFDKLNGGAFPECPMCGYTGNEEWWFEWLDHKGKPIRRHPIW